MEREEKKKKERMENGIKRKKEKQGKIKTNIS